MYCRALLARYFGWFSGGDADPRRQALLPPADTVLHPSAAALWALFWADTLSYHGDNSGMLERYAEGHRLALLSSQGQLAAAAGGALAISCTAKPARPPQPWPGARLPPTWRAAAGRRGWPRACASMPRCCGSSGNGVKRESWCSKACA